MNILKILKSIVVISLIAYTQSQCTVTDAENTSMKNWAVAAVSNALTSKLTCPQSGACTLAISYPTPDTSVLLKVKEYINFRNSSLIAQPQNFTSVDLNGLRTLSVSFTVSSINTFNAVRSEDRKSGTISYSFPVNLILTNNCLQMGLAIINGSIKLTINSSTGFAISTSSSMLQANLPPCAPDSCSVSTTFYLINSICSDPACATTSSGFKLGDIAYVKALLPASFNSLKFRLFSASYSVLGPSNDVVFASGDITTNVKETQGSGFNMEQWTIPVSTDVIGPNGQTTTLLRSIMIVMYFQVITGRSLRYLQAKPEVSQVSRSSLTLDPPITLNNTGISNSSNTTITSNNTLNQTNTSSGSFICVLSSVMLFLSMLI